MRLIPLLAALALLAPPAARAQTGNDCSLQAPSMEFDTYDVFATEPTRVAGQLRVTCQGASPMEVHLSAGQSGDFQNRSMVFGGFNLAYNLYVDAAEQRIAGDGTGGTSPLIGRQTRRVGAPALYNIYGKIAAHQLVGAGDYLDVMYVTVVF